MIPTCPGIILGYGHSNTELKSQFYTIIQINLSQWQSQIPYFSHGLNNLVLFNGIFAIISDLRLRFTNGPYFILLVFFLLMFWRSKRQRDVILREVQSDQLRIAPQEAQLHAWDETREFDLNSGRILHGTWTFSVLWTIEIPTYNSTVCLFPAHKERKKHAFWDLF